MRMPDKILLRCRCCSGRDGDGQRAVHRQTIGAAARHVGELLSLPLGCNDYRGRQCALLLESDFKLFSYNLSCSCTTTTRSYYCNRSRYRHKHGHTIKNW